MASIFKRRGTAVVAAGFAFIALVMIVAALLSEYWVLADLEREVGNSTQKGGSKHFGLFNGESKQDFGLGARERNFAGTAIAMGLVSTHVNFIVINFRAGTFFNVCVRSLSGCIYHNFAFEKSLAT